MLDVYQANLVRCASLLILLSTAFVGCDDTPSSSASAGAGGTAGAGSGSGGDVGGNGSNSSASSASSSSSSGKPMEVCVNDVDDDENGTMDCADPACSSTHKCVPSGPMDAKWSKPFQAALISFVDTNPTCASGAEPIVYGLGPSPNLCSQCACDVTNAICTGAELTCYDGQFCATVASTFVVNQAGCTPIVPGAFQGCKKTKPWSFDPAAAQCNVLSGGQPMVPQPFNQKLVRCDAPANAGGGCAAGESCAVKRNPEYAYLCVAASGKQTCPAGWTAPNVTGYESWTDTRSCSPCTCDINKAVCLPNEFSGHENPDCKPGAVSLSAAACTPLAPAVASIQHVPQAPFLQPSGCVTAPQGSLDLSGETTFCCRPAPP